MSHTNFSRNFYQASKDYVDRLEKYIKFDTNSPAAIEYYNCYKEAREFHHKAIKFLLPPGGQLLSIDDHKNIIKTQKRLSLPYPFICLEYTSIAGNDDELDPFLGYGPDNEIIHRPPKQKTISSPKRLVYAYQTENTIHIHPVFFMVSNDIGFGENWWKAIPPMKFSRNTEDFLKEDDKYAVLIPTDSAIAKPSDYSDEFSALLSFLVALNCINVSVSTSRAKKAKIKAKKGTKEPLGFDDYKILTVNIGDSTESLNKGHPLEYGRASPREHLRRGHIRQYQSGKTVWINSTVINKNKGGVITKSYHLT